MRSRTSDTPRRETKSVRYGAAAVLVALGAMVSGAVPSVSAEPSDTHTFSGTITAADDESALSGINISVFCTGNGCEGSHSDPAENPRRPWPAGARLLAEGVTDASGNWSLIVAEPTTGNPTILAWDPEGDLATERLRVSAWTDTTRADARLAKGGVLSGRITADGKAPPAGDYAVTANGYSAYLPPLGLLVDADGQYETPLLRIPWRSGSYDLIYPPDLPEPYAYLASCDYRVGPGVALLGVPAIGEDVVADHELTPPVAVSGHVTDTSGTGVEGISVVSSPYAYSTPWNLSAARFRSLTEDDGSYSFPYCPGADLELVFWSTDGSYVSEAYDNHPVISSKSEPILGVDSIAIPETGSVTHIDAELSRPGTISGRLVDSFGQPVPRESVQLCEPQVSEDQSRTCRTWEKNSRRVWARSSTTQSGSFEFTGVPAGTHEVSARSRTTQEEVRESVTLAEGGRSNVDLFFTTSGRIAGVVTDGTGAPIAGFPVSFGSSSNRVLTAADGTYVSPLLSARTHSVMFGSISRQDAVVVSNGELTEGIDARLDVGFIAGKVTSGGSPLGDVQVSLMAANARRFSFAGMTSADGTYRIAAAPGEHKVQFLSPWHVQQFYNARYSEGDAVGVSVVVGSAAGGIDAELVAIASPTAPPEGTVVGGWSSSRDGIPTFGASDTISISHDGCSGGYASAGPADFDLLRVTLIEAPSGSGTYVGSLDLGSFNITGWLQVTISEDCDGESAWVEFSVYIDPSGVVVDQFGKPVAGATVTLLRDNPGTVIFDFEAVAGGSVLMDPTVNSTNPDVTGADGRFRWDVVAGLWKIRAEAAGCHAPGDPSTAFVETSELEVPPPQLGLVVELECERALDGALVIANSGSLSDVGTAASMVAAGLGDAVVFAESPDALGSAAAGIVSQQQPKRVVFVGGTAALSASIETEVRGLAAGVQVERLAGTDRIHTAALAAQQVLAEVTSPTVVLANGWSLSDVGTAASAVASGRADAVLYARAASLSDPTRDVLEAHQPQRILIVGGTAALNNDVATQAQAAAGGTTPQRLGGATRIETATLSAQQSFRAGATTAVIANGWALNDVGIAAAIAAALDNSAVLYARPGMLDDATAKALTDHRPTQILIIDSADPADHALRTQIAQIAPGAAVIVISTPAQSTQRALGTAGSPRRDTTEPSQRISMPSAPQHVNVPSARTPHVLAYPALRSTNEPARASTWPRLL